MGNISFLCTSLNNIDDVGKKFLESYGMMEWMQDGSLFDTSLDVTGNKSS